MIAFLCLVCVSVGIKSGIPLSPDTQLPQAKALLEALASRAGIVTPTLVQSSVPAIFFTSQPSGTVVMASKEQLLRLSQQELAAGLAREVAHLKVFKTRGSRAISLVAQRVDDAKGAFETMGPWDQNTRREAVGFALAYLKGIGESPAALLTLLECESVDLGPLGRDVFEGWTGISMQELINVAKATLKEGKVRIQRSEVSLVYRVEEIQEAGCVSYRLFGQELFGISDVEAVTHPHLLRALNAFFDREPQVLDIRSANGSLFLGSDQVVTFSGPAGESRAGAAKLAIAKALFEYSRRTADFGSVPVGSCECKSMKLKSA